MKKLLFILPVFFFTLTVNAQTEDEVYIGKGKTFGKNSGRGIIIPDFGKTDAKPIKGQIIITGKVVGFGGGVSDPEMRGMTNSINLEQRDGTIVRVGTKDYEFSVPEKLEGRTITVEGIDIAWLPRKRRIVQQDIQFAATGIKVIDFKNVKTHVCIPPHMSLHNVTQQEDELVWEKISFISKNIYGACSRRIINLPLLFQKTIKHFYA